MTQNIKILGIAPYEELNISMTSVGKQFPNLDSDVYTADLKEGQELATKLYQTGYDAVISRGGTAKLIKETLNIPVIDVSISIYDILKAIRLTENYTDRFAIIGYPSITEKAHLLCDIMGYKIKIYTITEHMDVDQQLDELVSKNYELILCDAITNQLAMNKPLKTILITSGFESIKHAYEEAISSVNQIRKVQHNKALVEQAINSQNQQYIIFDQTFSILFSSVSETLETQAIHYLKTRKTLKSSNQFYTTFYDQLYNLNVERFQLDEFIYYSCLITQQPIPNLNNKLGVQYQKQSTIADIFSTKLIYKQFISEDVKQNIQQYVQHYHSYIVYGETGTAKKNIAYQIYLNQHTNHNYLITINCKLMNDKLWRSLVNSTNGPLVNQHNTILFENIEQLSLQEIERLTSLIQVTNLLKTNSLIFTYDSKTSDNSAKLSILMNQLNSANIYAAPIRERKNELSIIATLILNKINIECGKDVLGFDPSAFQAFLDYDWPGNFNQLQYAIKEFVINANSHYISVNQVNDLINREEILNKVSIVEPLSFSSKNNAVQPTLFDYTKEIILNVLEQNDGNQTKTAQQLDISRTTLWRYLKDR
ncbi:PrpR N-terminal domain-containing protein [Mammaliicoccus sciuri]|uniref:sigma-54-dependent transcriptional regulator n=1 Tax=Mammaliicoccus sciuri TaxID=1296 RepID=UPI00226FD12E|nr:sigma-54-dependent transcriptional regulator [Mammaliicoccus sciuri]MCY1024543.1 PrpR N-terminal domain-containing protein [Mammaliicoccus sciuri]MEB7436839.1 PrpR N-terminal domain-containing protein [Mammaliicoccus sciuri]MEB8294807.1 PrpR N-terminal domain-containing protein [Mammaliicoccus sciuri]